MEPYCVKTTAEQTGKRLDVFLAEQLPMTRSAIQALMENGAVTADGKKVAKNYRLRGGEDVTVMIPDVVPCEAVAQEIPLNIVYEDEHLLVVNKPKGMVVHPAAGHTDGTLVNALLAHCKGSLSGINGVLRPGIVHRIDKDTSGLLIVAKNDNAHQGLAAQIKEHSFTRIYEAMIVGHLTDSQGTVDAPIGRHPVDRKKMAITPKNSKSAVTHYRVLAEYSGYSHVQLKLETGRTHQIRVHMASLGHPVAGDTVYGSKKDPHNLNGQCLHAKDIGFIHPVTGKELYFTSDLPPYFTAFLDKLRSKG
ncbi:MAG: RluA family pseudouridine synthase [Ruminococcaceae bacterium]|nr:RluA family pseudouridine synthase [Oscillospiraceae bacterium]